VSIEPGSTPAHNSAPIEGNYRGLLEAAPDAMVVVNQDGEIVLLNVQAEKRFGYTREELVGQQVTSIIPEGFAQRLYADGLRSAAEALAQQIGTGIELTARRKDGSTFPIELMLSPLESTEGFLVTASIRDITLRESQQAKLIQAQKMEAIGHLTGGLAHDFNNLISIIIGNLDMLKDLKLGDESAQRMTSEALEAALGGADLTHRLLAFARQQPLDPKSVDINKPISNVIKLLSRTLGEGIEISFEPKIDLWPALVDRALLESCIVNLATNARDAMPKGGKLIFSTGNETLDTHYVAMHPDATPGDYAKIEVSDTGTGMTAETLDRLFEPFYTTKARGKGTGLGLSMVYGFVKQSGGHIGVYSEPGIGTTFRLYLPRATEAPVASKPVEDPALPRAAGETVLAVEDNDGLRLVVVRALKSLGYRVIEADGVNSALAILEGQEPDLLFTDIVMPGETDGIALARQALIRWPKLKVVLTSGFPDPNAIAGFGVIAPSALLLTKPYRKDALARMLRRALDG
jgi:PAS domain S-box-containing protein